MESAIQADYLVIGAGASGMAFVDTIVAESDATVVIVDLQDRPGGHWNDAYPFVTLHQPSAFYGVSSTELSSGLKDTIGLNKGLNELASGAEISAYYDNLMRQRFLPSGKVHYFPMSRYQGDGRFHCILSDRQFVVSPGYTLVDATYYKTSIPATHTPAFSVDDDVKLIPPNDLRHLKEPAEGYTIIGGGKTGIDTCLWLLEQGVSAEKLRWIIPRDGWLLDRKNTQPTPEFFFDSIGGQARQFEAIAESDSMQDMFYKLEAAGVFLRLDPTVVPSMFHGATISQAELQRLREIKQMVRLGRVNKLLADRIVLEQGEVPTSAQQVHVDCTASAITNLAITDVFTENCITLQTVRAYQPVFSASFIAHIDVNYETLEDKNRLCQVVPLPNHVEDWVELTYKNLMNQFFWSKEPGLKQWLRDNRLDGFMHLVDNVRFWEIEKLKVLNRMRNAAKPAVAKLKTYREELQQAR